jgi:hypothetical protein
LQREIVIRTAANEAELPVGFAKAVVAECPWLDGINEVSESLGIDLLSEQVAKSGVSPSEVERFLYAYNARVRSHTQGNA